MRLHRLDIAFADWGCKFVADKSPWCSVAAQFDMFALLGAEFAGNSVRFAVEVP